MPFLVKNLVKKIISKIFEKLIMPIDSLAAKTFGQTWMFNP